MKPEDIPGASPRPLIFPVSIQDDMTTPKIDDAAREVNSFQVSSESDAAMTSSRLCLDDEVRDMQRQALNYMFESLELLS